MALKLTGISYPFELDGSGGLKISSDENLIATHIISMLETEPGESPMRPNYGIPGNLFEAEQNFAGYAASVRRLLTREIPQARFEVVGELDDSGNAQLEIEWTVEGVFQEPLIVAIR